MTEEKDSPPSKAAGFWKMFQTHWHQVITYCAVFWSFGMCVAFLGPTLLDLGCLTSSDMKAISWVFFAQLLCSMLGASAAGWLVQREIISANTGACQANYLLLVSATVIPIAMFIIPFCNVLAGLAVVLALMGVNMGIIDCLANLQMINLFAERVPPFLQMMHFCYGVGAFVSPMIAEPFLLNEDCTPFIDNTTDVKGQMISPTGELISLNGTDISNMPAHSLVEAQHMTEVKYAFWIMAGLNIPVPLLVLSLTIRLHLRGWKPGHSALDESDTESTYSGTNGKALNEYGTITKSKGELEHYDSKPAPVPPQITSGQIIVITATASIMMFIYDGLQSAYGGYIYSFAVKSIADLSTTEGAYLNALFWGTFAMGRLLSIPLATRFSPTFMLLCNICGCTFAMTLMLFLRHNHVALYVGTFLFGTFLSSTAPTVISVAEAYIDITSTITSIIVVTAAVGEMVCPVIVGNLFVVLGPPSFLGFCEIMCGLSVFVFILLWFVGKSTPKNIEKGPSSFVWCRVCCIKKGQGDDSHVTQHVKYYGHGLSDSGSSNIELSAVAQENMDTQ